MLVKQVLGHENTSNIGGGTSQMVRFSYSVYCDTPYK